MIVKVKIERTGKGASKLPRVGTLPLNPHASNLFISISTSNAPDTKIICEGISKLQDELTKGKRSVQGLPGKISSSDGGNGGCQVPEELGIPFKRFCFDPTRGKLTDEWVREIGGHGWGNEEIQDYTDFDRNSFLSSDPSLGEGEDGGGGQLVIRAEVDHSTSTFTSARLISRQTLSLNRGYLRVVLTPPIAKGIWPAFWLLPSKPFTWPQEGEVDVFETWNADGINRSCLHWGHHHLEEDRGKHVVRELRCFPSGNSGGGKGSGHENSDSESTTRSFGFAWFQREDQDVGGGPGEERKQPSKGGELIWYVDDKAVMKSGIPSGLRDLKDWNMIVNLAMAGNVMGGQRPDDGTYLLILHSLEIYRHPPGGWDAFRKDFQRDLSR